MFLRGNRDVLLAFSRSRDPRARLQFLHDGPNARSQQIKPVDNAAQMKPNSPPLLTTAGDRNPFDILFHHYACHEGSIHFTRSIDYQRLANECSKLSLLC